MDSKPRKRPNRRKARTSATIDFGLMDKLNNAAKGRRGGVSGIIEDCVKAHFEGVTREPDPLMAPFRLLIKKLCSETDLEMRENYLSLIDDLSLERAENYQEYREEQEEMRKVAELEENEGA